MNEINYTISENTINQKDNIQLYVATVMEVVKASCVVDNDFFDTEDFVLSCVDGYEQGIDAVSYGEQLVDEIVKVMESEVW